MKNKIAFRLTLYFAGVLVVFALLIGTVFHQVFKRNIVESKRNEMLMRANKIAEVIGDNMTMLEKRFGSAIAGSRFISYLDRVTQENVWVVDSDRNLSMNFDENRGRVHEGRGGTGRTPRVIPRDPREAYLKLPEHIREQVEEAFKGRHFAVEDYNFFLDGIMLTVGTPVYDERRNIKAVVLLHSPVEGLHDAAWAALRVLGISLVGALVLAFALSIVLSWRFTEPLNKMKRIAERLAERDYPTRGSSIVQDDEIGELAKTLDLLAERLQLADQESRKLENLRREFIANISHELRTPVTVIRGSLEALRDGVVTGKEEVAEFYEQMHRESVFLQRLINDLLELSRLQNADFPMDRELLDICDVINNAVRSGRQLALAKKISVTFTSDSETYVIKGDYMRLRQMLMVFLDNAVKFSPEGGNVDITLSGGELLITDHGCGMEAEAALHACERFYKVRNEQNKSGSGLGLAIAKQIADRHDIKLEIRSVPGSGTSICLTLPKNLSEGSENENF